MLRAGNLESQSQADVDDSDGEDDDDAFFDARAD